MLKQSQCHRWGSDVRGPGTPPRDSPIAPCARLSSCPKTLGKCDRIADVGPLRARHLSRQSGPYPTVSPIRRLSLAEALACRTRLARAQLPSQRTLASVTNPPADSPAEPLYALLSWRVECSQFILGLYETFLVGGMEVLDRADSPRRVRRHWASPSSNPGRGTHLRNNSPIVAIVERDLNRFQSNEAAFTHDQFYARVRGTLGVRWGRSAP